MATLTAPTRTARHDAADAAAAPARRPAVAARHALALACCLAAAPALAARQAPAEATAEARHDVPTARYGHYALGRPHEHARLVAVTDRGRALTIELPADEVFEDIAPRRVRLAPQAPAEWLAVVSGRAGGARLALFGLRDGRLARVAASGPIGRPMRWLNPVGVADLDGDGQAEIAAVVTPHIGGRLKV